MDYHLSDMGCLNVPSRHIWLIAFAFPAATRACTRYTTNYKGKQFTIIDTPGLADSGTYERNMEILDDIARQLSEMGHKHVTGIVYLHSIKLGRLTGTDKTNFEILKAICGEDFPHVAFVTTHWDRINLADPKCRTYFNNINFDVDQERRKFLRKGPRGFQFHNDGESHKQVLDYFAGHVDNTAEVGAEPPQLLFAAQLQTYQYKRKPKRALRKTEAAKRLEAESQKVSGGLSCCVIL